MRVLETRYGTKKADLIKKMTRKVKTIRLSQIININKSNY